MALLRCFSSILDSDLSFVQLMTMRHCYDRVPATAVIVSQARSQHMLQSSTRKAKTNHNFTKNQYMYKVLPTTLPSFPMHPLTLSFSQLPLPRLKRPPPTRSRCTIPNLPILGSQR